MTDDNNKLADSTTQRNAELAALALLVMFSGLLVVRQFITPIPAPILLILGGGCASGLCALIMKRQGKAFAPWVGLLIFCLFLGNSYSLFKFGGLHSPVILFLPAIPISAAIFVGRKFGIFMLGCFIVQTFSLVSLHLTGYQFGELPMTGIANTLLTGFYVILIGIALMLIVVFDQSRRSGETKDAQSMAETDFLTGLLNRAGFEKIFLRRGMSKGRTSAIVAIDIDHFKECNDTRGHDAGDRCLREIAIALKNSLQRDEDFIGRVGGDEFMAVLSHTDEAGAMAVAERMRQAVSDLHIFTDEDTPRKITVTVGVASFSGDANEELDALYKIVDLALYRGKNDGKNCIKSATANVYRLHSA